MSTQQKNKMLVIIIAILLIANIVTLSLLLMNKQERARSGRADKKAMITAFLKKDVGFSDEQLSRYDAMSTGHRTKTRSVFDNMSANREVIFEKLASQEFSDSAIDIASGAIAEQQRDFELIMLRHLKEIRSICTPAQKQVFDTGFYKIIAKRGGETRKDKTKN